MNKYAVLATAVILVMFLSGCTDDTDNTQLANPAAVKCIEDGFELVPAENGTTMCVSPDSQCNQWDYFRGECEL